MVVLAVVEEEGREIIMGVAQFRGHEGSHTAEVAVVVKEEFQNRGIGTELLRYLTYIAKQQGLIGFYMEVLKENRVILHLFVKMGFSMEKETLSEVFNLSLGFRES